MQHHHRALVAHRAHRVLESDRFGHGLRYEAFDHGFPERSEHAAAKTADEALHPHEGDAVRLVRLAVEQVHAGGLQNLLYVFDLVGLVIVIAEHADDRDRAGAQLLGKNLGLARLADVGEVAAKHQHFCLGRDFRE